MPIDKAKVDRALALIKKGSANADYFFEQLKSPVWIEALAREGLFSKPYNTVHRGESLSFPIWVPGQYLARMAAIPEAQAQVLQILRELPESDNPRVYEVIADAASSLPPKMAKHLVSQLLRGMQLPFQFVFPEKVASVIVRLADARLVHDALRLTRALLAIVPSPAPTADSDDGVNFHLLHRRAKGQIDDWQYGQVLDQILKSLVSSSGLDGFRLLCELLEEAVIAGRL